MGKNVRNVYISFLCFFCCSLHLIQIRKPHPRPRNPLEILHVYLESNDFLGPLNFQKTSKNVCVLKIVLVTILEHLHLGEDMGIGEVLVM